MNKNCKKNKFNGNNNIGEGSGEGGLQNIFFVSKWKYYSYCLLNPAPAKRRPDFSSFCDCRLPPPSAPKPDPELKKLMPLVGHWTYEEEWKAGALGPGGKMTGVYDAHMILGGFFLQAEQTEKGDMGEIRNLEIDAYDPVNKNFTSDVYQSDGEKSSLTITVSGNTITWAGKIRFGSKECACA